MGNIADLHFVDNPVVRGREDKYETIEINVPAVLESWRLSLFSYEWILPDGRIRGMDELSALEQPKRKSVETALSQQKPLEKPILGIGLLDNVEIGSGRAVFLTLAARGCRTMPVHVPKSSLKDFDAFRV